MGIKFVGWGKWGEDVCQILKSVKPEISANISAWREANFGLTHIPDPVISHHLFYSWPEESIKRPIDPLYDYHLHIIHAADNFGTGAVTGLMHRLPKTDKKPHLALILLPPRGSNSATVGRLLTNLLGMRNFFEVSVVVDLSAPIFADWDSVHMLYYIAGLCAMFYTFEQSACMLPLLEQLDSYFLSFAAAPIQSVLSESSLIPIWRQLSIPVEGTIPLIDQPNKILAFSVSDKPDKNIYQIYKRNIEREKFFYIPFTRLYDWKELCSPENFGLTAGIEHKKWQSYLKPENIFSTFGKFFTRKNENFTALFVSDIPDISMNNFLECYIQKYWPKKNKQQYEYLEPEILDWCSTNNMGSLVSLQDKHLLRNALEFIKKRNYIKRQITVFSMEKNTIHNVLGYLKETFIRQRKKI